MGYQGMPVGSKASAVVTSDFAYGKEGSRELNVQPGAKVLPPIPPGTSGQY